MNEAELLWKLIGILSILVGLAVAIKKLFFSRLPQPLEVRESETFMPRRECHANHAVFEARLSGLERRLDAALTGWKQDVTQLHEKINESEKQSAARHAEVMRAIGRLEGE